MIHIYNNGSKFKRYFQSLWDTYGIKHKPTSVKNPQANAIQLDMAETVKANEIDDFFSAAWAICSTYHTVLNVSPGAAIFR